MRCPCRHIAQIGVAVLALVANGEASPAADGDRIAAISRCREFKGDAERLACFDAAAARLAEPTFQGRLGLVTEPFEITRPTRLRFQSMGVIFVLYLKAEDGTVVQNLHIGGGGEDSYVIEQPGRYFLQINGSESWKIWLEPV